MQDGERNGNTISNGTTDDNIVNMEAKNKEPAEQDDDEENDVVILVDTNEKYVYIIYFC